MCNFRAILLLCLSFVLFAGQSVQAGNLEGKTIRFCGDGSGWPPYTYANPNKPDEVLGYDVDVITEILAKHNVKAEFFMPSWKQCLEHSEKGKVFHVALSASYSEERDAKYLLSDAYYSITQNYFYAKSRFEKKPDIKTADDLFKLGKVCGRYAYNYEGTGVMKNSQIVQAGKSYNALIMRTLSSDCAFFLARPSIILGFSLVGKKLIDPLVIGYSPIPGAKKDDFYMMISRQFPHAEELRDMINKGVAQMKASGRLQDILDHYYQEMGSKV
ncbi:putative amino acid ABC transporter [Candidatus Terasakiella magnetica]|uniref:Putative amino acid ABC transporter n=1 Tax=Candidatus Terasakiella magnetica TaxID=1867952 RepID=A0A1C3RK97_9PROT|nr:transporter substrate-binding domain-containing protein [Candidatus Terasakiella magnetica]SCA57665.1 putative amino acid ABC transporter [Candidatus Terasakiella magnetica]